MTKHSRGETCGFYDFYSTTNVLRRAFILKGAVTAKDFLL